MKKENIKNKLKGILIILIGLVLAAVGVWLYSKVWGINLLFTDSSLGKVARFYWIFLIAAVIVVALGIRKFRKRVIVEQETENSAQSDEPGAQNNESFNAEAKETEASKEKAGEQPDKQPTEQSDKQPGKEVTAAEPAGETKAGAAETQQNVAEEQPKAVQAQPKAAEAQPESVKEEKSAKKSFMKKKAGNTCPNCNKPIGKGNKFCTSCGYKLV